VSNPEVRRFGAEEVWTWRPFSDVPLAIIVSLHRGEPVISISTHGDKGGEPKLSIDLNEAELYDGTTSEPEPVEAARTCRHCGVPIEMEDGDPDRWVDVDSIGLVFCTDQDETHDGQRHEPEEGAS